MTKLAWAPWHAQRGCTLPEGCIPATRAMAECLPFHPVQAVYLSEQGRSVSRETRKRSSVVIVHELPSPNRWTFHIFRGKTGSKGAKSAIRGS